MAKHEGQQTRFDPGADGHSPDERERDGVCAPARKHLRWWSHAVLRPVHTNRLTFMTLSTPLESNPAVSPAAKPRARIAFIQACWHRDIVDQCKASFLDAIQAQGFSRDDVDLYEVAGAFEIPLHAKLLAQRGDYAAIVAAGLVVDGGIYRHEFVAQAVISGLMQVQLETGTPVLSAVLTPHHFHSGEEHTKFFREHFVVKGVEAATACADTIRKVAALANVK